MPGVPRLANQPQPSPDTTVSDRHDRDGHHEARDHHDRAPAPTGRRAGPVPRHVHDADGRRHLDGGGQGAQGHSPHGVSAPGGRHPGQEQAHHDGVVVGPAYQGQQGQRVEHREHEGGTRVATEGHRQFRDAVGDQRHADHGLQPEEHHRDEGLVKAERRRPARHHEEERAVGRRRVLPEGVDPRDVGTGPQGARSEVVRVDVAAHHLALGRIGEHVLAEERGHDEEWHQPEGQHDRQLTDGHTGATPQHLIETEPDADEQDHPAVHGDDARQHHHGGRPGGHTEEPGATEVELERRAGERGADADGGHGQEPEQRRTAQERPVVRVARSGLHPLAQGDA